MTQREDAPQTRAAEVRVEITEHSQHAIARIIEMLPPATAPYTATAEFGHVYLIGVASIEQGPPEAVEETGESLSSEADHPLASGGKITGFAPITGRN